MLMYAEKMDVVRTGRGGLRLLMDYTHLSTDHGMLEDCDCLGAEDAASLKSALKKLSFL